MTWFKALRFLCWSHLVLEIWFDLFLTKLIKFVCLCAFVACIETLCQIIGELINTRSSYSHHTNWYATSISILEKIELYFSSLATWIDIVWLPLANNFQVNVMPFSSSLLRLPASAINVSICCITMLYCRCSHMIVICVSFVVYSKK